MIIKKIPRLARRLIRCALLMDSYGASMTPRLTDTLLLNFFVVRRIQMTLLLPVAVIIMEAIFDYDCIINDRFLLLALIVFSFSLFIMIYQLTNDIQPFKLYAKLTDDQRIQIAKYRRMNNRIVFLEFLYLAMRVLYELYRLINASKVNP